MEVKRLLYYIFLFICHIASAKLIHLEGLEKTFDLFENRCFVNTLFVGFTVNFVLHDTPIQHTTIDRPLPMKWFTHEILTKRNAKRKFVAILET